MSTGRTEKEQVRVHIRWMIRRDMPEVLQIEQESFEYRLDRGGLPPLPPPAQLHRHGGRAGREGRRLHDLRAAQDQAAHPQLRRPPDVPRAASVGARWSPSSSASCRATAARASRWKCARRTWPPSSSSASRSFRAVRVLRSFYEDTGEDAFLMQYRFGDDIGEDVRGGGQPHRPVRGELTRPHPRGPVHPASGRRRPAEGRASLSRPAPAARRLDRFEIDPPAARRLYPSSAVASWPARSPFLLRTVGLYRPVSTASGPAPVLILGPHTVVAMVYHAPDDPRRPSEAARVPSTCSPAGWRRSARAASSRPGRGSPSCSLS